MTSLLWAVESSRLEALRDAARANSAKIPDAS